MKKVLSIIVVALCIMSCSKERPVIPNEEKPDEFAISYNPFARSIAADTIARYEVTFSGNYGYDSPIKVAQQFCYWLKERIEGETINRNGIVCYVEFPDRHRAKFLSLIAIIKTDFEIKEIQ